MAQGLSLRDHYAGLAMAGMLAGDRGPDQYCAAPLARACFAIADAMIREREVLGGLS